MSCEEHRAYAEVVADAIQNYILGKFNPTRGQREDLDDMFVDLRIALSELDCPDRA